jgi:hypothetical protein
MSNRLLRTTFVPLASSKLASPAIACAENISLLHLLHSVPHPPLRNPNFEFPSFQRDYVLSTVDESTLVGHIVFLSNTHNNPNYIPALCVQQSPIASSMTVLLAVNSIAWNDGDSTLLGLKRGFEALFATIDGRSFEVVPRCID